MIVIERYVGVGFFFFRFGVFGFMVCREIGFWKKKIGRERGGMFWVRLRIVCVGIAK